MCGLCGVFGIVGPAEKNAFSMLSMLSQTRGKDSTGVGLIYQDKKKPPVVVKSVGGQETLAIDNPNLFDTRSWVTTEVGLLCIIGHNRWATVGEVNKENAHPFHEKNIIGCHNGTIPNHQMTHLGNHSYKITDSQILIKELGEGEDIAKLIEYLRGAWALTWFDTKKRKLHMCRNNERTLFVAKSTDGRALFWASESWMLTAGLSRAGVKFGDVLSVTADKHLIWKVGKGGVINLESSNEAVGGKSKYMDTWGLNHFLNPYKGYGKNNVVPIRKEKQEENSEDYEEEYVEIEGGGFIHRRLFESRIKDGCSNCTGDLTWEGRDQIVWADYQSPLCLDCADHLTSKEKVH
jgi:predicted glutamine amidotransferase